MSAYSDAVQGDSPISYYRLGESSGTTAADLQGANAGTYNGGFTLAQTGPLSGDANTAVLLDGVNGSYVLAKAGFILASRANWTIELWLKMNGHPAADKAIYCERGASGNDILKLQVTSSGPGGLLQLVYRDDAGTIDFTPTSVKDVTDNVWHHIVLTKSGTTVQFYVDGVANGSAGTLTASNTFTDTLSSRVGGDIADGSAYANATIDEVALYSTALGSTAVAAHYAIATASGGSGTYQSSVVADTPISYWRLGDLSGAAKDERSVNPGTYVGGFLLNQPGAISGDAAVTLDGANGSYVLAKAAAIIAGLTNWTIECWIKVAANPATDKALYSERGASGNDILKLNLVTTGQIQFVFRGDSGAIDFAPTSASTAVANGAWHHIVLTKSGTTAQIYIDGAANGSPATLTGTNTFTDALSARIGGDAQDGSAYLAGSIDEVAVYNAALSGARVLAHYQAATSAVVAYVRSDSLAFSEVRNITTTPNESFAITDAPATTTASSTAKATVDSLTLTDTATVGYGLPAAPVLTATAGDGQVLLSWTTPASGGSAITGYKLYRGTTLGGETLYQTLGVVNGYVDTGVTNGSTYYYQVRATNASGDGALSSERKATPNGGGVYIPIVDLAIEVAISLPSAPTTAIAILEGARQARWYDPLNEIGTGSFVIARKDPKVAAVAKGNIATFRLQGIARYAIAIETREVVAASVNGESGEYVSVTGRGTEALLSRAKLAPGSGNFLQIPVGQLLATSIDAAKARGALPASLTYDFTAAADSVGAPWLDSATYQLPNGLDYLEVLKMLPAIGIDVAMGTNLVLHAYRDGLGTDRTSQVVFRQGKHIRGEVKRAEQGAQQITRIWVEGKTAGFPAIQAFGDETDPSVGIREGYLKVATTDEPTILGAAGQQAIDVSTQAAKAISLPLLHGLNEGDYEPYDDYGKGDHVKVNVPGVIANEVVRVMAIAVAATADGGYTVDVDGNAIVYEELVRLKRELDALASTVA